MFNKALRKYWYEIWRFYRIIRFNAHDLKNIDTTISKIDLTLENSSLKKDKPSWRNPNLRISKQAYIRELSFCKSFYDIGQK